MVSDIFIICQFSKNCQLFHFLFIQRKNVFVLNQGDGFLCCPFGQCNVLFAAYHRHVVFFVASVKCQNGADNPKGCLVNLAFRNKAVLHSFYQLAAKILGNAHLHILAAVGCFYGIFYAVNEIAHDKTVKIPFSFQYGTEEIFVVAALYLVVQVVRTHDGSSACIDAVFKVGQENFPLCPFVCVNADFKPGIFHLVECKMLYAGHDIFILHTTHQSSPHLADGKGFFSIGLLASAPSRIVRKVDTHACKQISSKCSGFFSDHMSNSFLQFRVKGSTSCHGYWKTGSLALSAHHTSWAVAELHGRDHALNATCRIRGHVIVTVIAA